MKMKDFRIRTSKGEIIKLKEIKTLSFGIMTDDKWHCDNKDLFIVCEQGHLKFPLEEICSITFSLAYEKYSIVIESHSVGGKDED